MSGMRRFQVHYGQQGDDAGYVVTDRELPGWRGGVVFRTDNKSEAEAEAERRNEEEGDAR